MAVEISTRGASGWDGTTSTGLPDWTRRVSSAPSRSSVPSGRAGAPTTVVARRAAAVDEATARIQGRLDAHVRLGLRGEDAAAAAQDAIEVRLGPGGGPYDVVVESIAEDAAAKRELLSR